MTKPELRTLYKSKRNELSPEMVDEISLQILNNLKLMNIWGNLNFHLFMSIHNHKEINTLPILNYLFAQKKQVIVPKVENDRMLNCLIHSNVEFETGKFHVPEPKSFQLIDSKEIDVVFVPMLICDKSGNRIGYGGGFYDRFLKECRENIIKIGLNFFEPIDEIEDVFETDIPLDYCVTGEEIVSFFV